MIDEEINLLKKEFKRIKNMEYIRSIKKGNTGVSETFFSLLCEDFNLLEVEIKVKRSYSKAYITLFSAVPVGDDCHEIKRLRDLYGYNAYKDKNLKKLYIDVGSDDFCKLGVFYFRLYVDRNNYKIFLCVYDYYKNLIDNSAYWGVDVLCEKLYIKLHTLALIKAWPKKIGEYEYFKYYKMNVYILKGFDEFIDLIEKGIIRICFKIGSCWDSKRYGQVSSYNVCFSIREEDLFRLFDIYR